MYLYLNIPIVGGRFIQAFSWMLIHSLWQGLLLAIVTAILLQVSKSAAARWRYSLIFTLFVLFILACGFTFLHEMGGSPHAILPLANTIGHNASQLLHLDAVNVQLFAAACTDYISTHAVWLMLLWMAFFVFRSFGVVKGLCYMRKARYQYTQPAYDWQERLTVLGNKLHISRPIRLLESALVNVPMVIGHLKPVILMPAGLLTGLPAEQIEAVLLHELAHIRRHDYLVNLLQTFCEAVFFFNPGLLWISALLRNEREHCCDDMALEQTGNRKEFIQALISFKEHALYANDAAVAFPGKRNQLLHRVSRILHNKNQSLEKEEKVLVMAGIVLLLAFLLTAAITQLRNIEHQLLREPDAIVVFNTSAPLVPLPKEQLVKAIPKHHLVKAQTKVNTVVAELVTTPEVTFAAAPPAASAQEPERLDRIQAEQDRELAVLHRAQAERDRQQADKDREQAMKDRLQAAKDREQARLDRIQADKDREQAERDRQQAVKEREALSKQRNAAQ